MVDQLMILGIVLLSIVIIAIVVMVVWVFFREASKRKVSGPSRIELYFDENFRNLVDEWDLQSRSKVKAWRTDVMKRLDGVSGSIDQLKVFQKKMDTRLTNLNREMLKLERA